MLTFDREIGAHCDVKELEYISALMQTGEALRSNGSLSVDDVCLYLTSRHGIVVEKSTAQQLLARELAGQTNESEPEFIDLCQFVSILLLPYLVEKAQSGDSSAFDFFVQGVVGKDADGDDSTSVTCEKLRLAFDSFADLNISDQLLHEMVKVCSGTGGSITKALTGNVLDYSCDWKDTMSLSYDGALRAGGPKDETEEEEADPELSIDLAVPLKVPTLKRDSEHGTPEKRESHPLARIYTAASVDYVAETYRRPFFVMALWTCGIALYFAYVFQTGEGEWSQIDCGDSVGCTLANGIMKWLAIFVQLSTLGVAFIFLGSLGSSIYVKKKIVTLATLLLGMGAVAFFSIVPFFVGSSTAFWYTYGTKFGNPDISGASYYISVSLGFWLLAIQVVDFCFVLVPKLWLQSRSRLQSLVTPANMKAEMRTKQAAHYKISNMVDNAMVFQRTPQGSQQPVNRSNTSSTISRSSEKASVNAALNFQLHGVETERIGGVIWAWKRILNGTIFSEEGVWLHSRLWSCNFSHIIVGGFIIFFALLGYFSAESLTTPASDDTFDVYEDDSLSSSEEILSLTAVSYYLAISVALVAALTVVTYVAVIYIPSHISVVLKFRCGEFKSLRGRDFLISRAALDVVTVLFGSAFWGTFFASAAAALLFGGIVVLVSISSGTLGPVIGAWVLGYVVVLILKQVVLCILRFHFFSGYYRKRPAAANIFFVVMECWNVGLAVGFILVRFLKIMILAIFFVARSDTPFLAPGVGVFGHVELDAYPRAFRKDALLHEAHRHPYIERFGMLCLVKLRLGDSFARRPHACWRLLYTLCLMPWLRKYRVGISTDEEVEDLIEKLEVDIDIDESFEIDVASSRRQKIEILKSLRRSSLDPDEVAQVASQEQVELLEGLRRSSLDTNEAANAAREEQIEILKNLKGRHALNSREDALQEELEGSKHKLKKLKKRNSDLKSEKKNLQKALKAALNRAARLEQQMSSGVISSGENRS